MTGFDQRQIEALSPKEEKLTDDEIKVHEACVSQFKRSEPSFEQFADTYPDQEIKKDHLRLIRNYQEQLLSIKLVIHVTIMIISITQPQ